MKINDVVKDIPPETKKMEYFDRELNLKYVISQDRTTLVYKLFVEVPDGYKLIKTRTKDPLFPEVI